MRILVTGSRNWTDRDLLTRAIVQAMADLAPLQPGQVDYNDGDWTIVHGACPTGADAIAEDWAYGAGYQLEPHPADWAQYGKAAGPSRNAEMVGSGVDACLGFVTGMSKGTWNCIGLARELGVPTRIYADDSIMTPFAAPGEPFSVST